MHASQCGCFASILASQICSACSTPAWSNVPDEASKLLPRQPFVRKQPGFQTSRAESGSGRKTVVVAFLGGVTFAEVAALRFLQSRPETNADFIICASKLINGTSFLQSFQEDIVLAASAVAAF